MPTPFTHLVVAARLLEDARVPADVRAALADECGAFLLGSIAADARVSSGLLRENTHFYAYDRPITEHPWRVMLAQYPALWQPKTLAQRVFVAAYVAHLALDELWSVQVVRPYFGDANWAGSSERFFLLNALLVKMDMRDYRQLPDWQRAALLGVAPRAWVPFMSDADLAGWRDFVGTQLPPDGHSQTLAVIGERVGRTPADLQALIDSDEAMALLWQNLPKEVVAQAEQSMAERARRDLLAYWAETAG